MFAYSFLLSLCLFGATDAFAASDPLDRYNVVWDTPSKDHNGSMPIGNGEMGLNVWVEPNGDLVFLVARTDSWDENMRLCKIGRVRIKFTPPLTGDNFRQTLRLRQGEIEVAAGVGDSAVSARIWVDANRQVAHVDAWSQSNFQMQAAWESWRTEKRTLEKKEGHGIDSFPGPVVVYPDTIVGGQKNRIVCYHRNPVSPWKSTLEMQHLKPAIEIGSDPLLHRTFGAVVQGKGFVGVDDKTLKTRKPGKRFSLAIYTKTVTPATEAEWLAAIQRDIDKMKEIRPTKTLMKHRRWWNDFWNRSWVYVSGDAEAETITRGYMLQRWINACGGRGRYPIKFNGTIFTVNTVFDADYRQWGGCYWLQNTRLPYWSMLAAGDYDLMRPLFRMYREAMPLAKLRTQIYFGHEGAFFPETMSFWGTYNNGYCGWNWRTDGKPGDPIANPYIRFHYNGTLELLAMMLDYYAYTGDRDFLDSELLPFADECLLWWDEHWKRDAKGKLKMFPSYSLETFWNVTNPAPDVAGLQWDLDWLLSLSDDEIGADRRKHWAKLRGAVPNLPMREVDGKKALSPVEGKIPRGHNRENPELYAIFPFRIYGVGKPDLEMARRTFEIRRAKRNSGWCQDDIQAAWLGLAETAAKYVAGRAANKHRGSRFPAFWGPNSDWIPDQDHGANLLIALQSMLLQADEGKLLLLPAWPKKWNVNFKLHAPQKTIVEGTVRDGKLEKLKVTPQTRRKDIVILPVQ